MKSFAALAQPAQKRWLRLADGLAAAVAAALPWSTSVTTILIVLWLIVVLPTLDPGALRRVLLTPAGGLPVLLCGLALAGMLWAASDVTWKERFGGFDSFPRLLLIPVLLAQFGRSDRAIWCVRAFAASCVVLLAASALYAFVPLLRDSVETPGVPVRDYIVQAHFFQICSVGLLYLALDRAASPAGRALCAALAILFVADIAYVASSRTAFVVMPVLLLLLGWRRFGWRGLAAAGLAALVLGGGLWASSSYMRGKLSALVTEAQRDRTDETQTSTGQRIEFYRKSLGFVAAAPVIGHGTGSIAPLFRKAAAGQSGAAGVVAANPHQQTLGVAIQLGLVGAGLLWAMWAAHGLIFLRPGLLAWLGLALVVQNVGSSLFNSHLFDFAPGWLYVFGVGICGGAMLRAARDAPATPPVRPVA